MPATKAFKRASQNIIQYHSRRTHVHSALSVKEKWLYYGSLAGVLVGLLLLLSAGTAMLGTFTALVFAGFYLGLDTWMSPTNRNSFTRREATEVTRIYGQAIPLLTHTTEPEAVGPLADVLWLPDITGYVSNALCKLLPRLELQHASLLNRKQRDSLMQILTQPEAHTLELRADAETALFELQKRIDPGYIGRNLLRASDAHTISPDVLLRPATGSSETPSQELLRAQNSP